MDTIESALESDICEVRSWSDGLDDLHVRIANRFSRKEPKRRVLFYLRGLLSPVERKNGWQLAEYSGDATPYGVQRLVSSYERDAGLVRDDLRGYVIEHLGGPDGVLVVDETGFIKKGVKSVGVKRQYSGTAGRIENCQIGVFLAYASSKGRAFLDRELYLPHEWAEDCERRSEAGVPEDVDFKTKSQLARAMLERAFESGVPMSWVTADEVYSGLRVWLEEREVSYVLAIKSSEKLWTSGFVQQGASSLAAEVPSDQWTRLSAGDGAKGPRIYDWVSVPIRPLKEPGKGYWLLVRRSVEKPDELDYYACYGPDQTPVEELVRVAGTRWIIEEGFEEAKGEVGLDHYEVRKWEGWYRHVTLALLAHAYLAVIRSHAAKKGELRPRSCCP